MAKQEKEIVSRYKLTLLQSINKWNESFCDIRKLADALHVSASELLK